MGVKKAKAIKNDSEPVIPPKDYSFGSFTFPNLLTAFFIVSGILTAILSAKYYSDYRQLKVPHERADPTKDESLPRDKFLNIKSEKFQDNISYDTDKIVRENIEKSINASSPDSSAPYREDKKQTEVPSSNINDSTEHWLSAESDSATVKQFEHSEDTIKTQPQLVAIPNQNMKAPYEPSSQNGLNSIDDVLVSEYKVDEKLHDEPLIDTILIHKIERSLDDKNNANDINSISLDHADNKLTSTLSMQSSEKDNSQTTDTTELHFNVLIEQVSSESIEINSLNGNWESVSYINISEETTLDKGNSMSDKPTTVSDILLEDNPGRIECDSRLGDNPKYVISLNQQTTEATLTDTSNSPNPIQEQDSPHSDANENAGLDTSPDHGIEMVSPTNFDSVEIESEDGDTPVLRTESLQPIESLQVNGKDSISEYKNESKMDVNINEEQKQHVSLNASNSVSNDSTFIKEDNEPFRQLHDNKNSDISESINLKDSNGNVKQNSSSTKSDGDSFEIELKRMETPSEVCKWIDEKEEIHGAEYVQTKIKALANTDTLRVKLANACIRDRISTIMENNDNVNLAINAFYSILDIASCPTIIASFAYRKIIDKYVSAGDYAKAISEILKLIKLNPNQNDIKAELGTYYIYNGMYGEAQTVLEEVLRNDKNNGIALLNLGSILIFSLNQHSPLEEVNKVANMLAAGLNNTHIGYHEPRHYQNIYSAFIRSNRENEVYKYLHEAVKERIILSATQLCSSFIHEIKTKQLWTPAELIFNWNQLNKDIEQFKDSHQEYFANLQLHPENQYLVQHGTISTLELYQDGHRVGGCDNSPELERLCNIISKVISDCRFCDAFIVQMSKNSSYWKSSAITNVKLRSVWILQKPKSICDLKLHIGNEIMSFALSTNFTFDPSFIHSLESVINENHEADFEDSWKLLVIDSWHPFLSIEAKSELSN